MKTRLYIFNGGWREVELYDNLNIAISFAVAEVRDISKKSASHSATISIPNTPGNAQLFGCIHEITAYNASFELLKTYLCRIEQDCRDIFDGYFELTKVINNGGVFSYEGTVYSTIRNVSELLGGAVLRDLDMSEYDMPSTATSISNIATRLASSPIGVGFTLIDKTRRNNLKWHVDEITPYIKAIDIFGKIMSTIGQNWSSNFLGGTTSVGGVNFADVIYPYSKHNDTMEAAPAASSAVVQRSIFSEWNILQVNNGTSQYADVTLENNGNAINFSVSYQLDEHNMDASTISAYMFKAPRQGKYKFTIRIPFALMMSCNAWVGSGWSGIEYAYFAQNHLKANSGATSDNDITLICNMGGVAMSKNFQLPDDCEPMDIGGKAWYTILTETIEVEGEKWMSANETLPLSIYCDSNFYHAQELYHSKMYIDVQSASPSTEYDAIPYKMQMRVLDGMEWRIEQVSTWGEGSSLSASSILSDKTTQWSFLNGLFKTFNLFAEDDGNGSLRIEPYSLFYANRPSHDWSDKVDRSTMSFERIVDYVRKVLDFKQTSDADSNTKSWKEWHDIEIGETKIMGNLCTDTNDKEEILSPFGQNIMTSINNVWMPMLYALDNNGNIAVDADLIDRLLLKSTISDDYSHNTIHSRYSSSWVPVWSYTKSTADGIKYSSGIYDGFWKSYVLMLNNANSRILTCRCYLSAKDISELRMSDTIVIDHQQYHINAIKEWSSGETSCEVELIRVL